MMASAVPMRIEEARLDAVQTQRLLVDGGRLVHLSPGRARRARSVNARSGSSLPLDPESDDGEARYAERERPAPFGIAPFAPPRRHDRKLALETVYEYRDRARPGECR